MIAILGVLFLSVGQARVANHGGALRKPDLVELQRLIPSLRLDIRYETTHNFVHRAVYREARAFLQRPAAFALACANATLRKQGYGLVIFDGYRPWSVTKLFWKLTPPDKRAFVADPKHGSHHNRGCAVDLTLFDLRTGKEVEMPSDYDEPTQRAYAAYGGGSSQSRRLRRLLRQAMEAVGFRGYAKEWWHFDYKDWPYYPLMNIPFERLKLGNTSIDFPFVPLNKSLRRRWFRRHSSDCSTG